MSRKAEAQQLHRLAQAIARHPGRRAGFFARLLGWRHEAVNRRLVTLNDRGVLLAEDEHGGLWPFHRQRPPSAP
jgi:hypothetical protein